MWSRSTLRPRTSTRPQPSPLLGSGGAAPCPFLPAVAGGTGRRAPDIGGEGQERSGTGGWVFPCQKWTFCLPNGAGWRAGGCRSPRSCYTPSFVCAWVRNTLVLPSPAPPVGIPARLCPAGGCPRAAPPVPLPTRRVAPLPFFFTRAGLSLTFVCGENGGALVIWKDERQMGMTRGLLYSLACEHNSELNKSLTG